VQQASMRPPQPALFPLVIFFKLKKHDKLPLLVFLHLNPKRCDPEPIRKCRNMPT
jgi:hypothetical protein